MSVNQRDQYHSQGSLGDISISALDGLNAFIKDLSLACTGTQLKCFSGLREGLGRLPW